MTFSGPPEKDGDRPKRRSIWGTMFNPDIGDSIRPLGETTSVFVNLIAMIFAMNGLFPKDHPALLGTPGARLSLSEVIGTAWSDLSFTRAGLPKVILFIAVAGSMILAVLSVITAFLSVFMGSAHAATTATTAATATASTGFFAAAGTDDLAQNWLDYIFKGVPLSDYYSQNGTVIPQSNSIQCAMMSALGFYSNGMLVFAAVILFYHLVAMVVHTAHEGVVMGKKANQVWAPIRLVVAVGLLVPVGAAPSACPNHSGAGLNSGQYIVIQMASWGSGLASQTWNSFITTLGGMGNDYIQPDTPTVTAVVTDIANMEACRYTWNYQVCMVDANNDASKCTTPNNYPPTQPSNKNLMIPAPTAVPNAAGDTYSYEPGGGNGQGPQNSADICGKFVVPAAIATAQAPPTVGNTIGTSADPGTIAQILSQAHRDTIASMLGDFEPLGSYVAKLIPTLNDGDIPPNTAFVTLVNKYQSTLKTKLDAALKGQHGITATQVTAMNSLGWAGAGAWLNTIARDQGAIVNAYQDGLPQTITPSKAELQSSPPMGPVVLTKLHDFNTWLTYHSSKNSGCDDQPAASAGASSPTSGPMPTNSGSGSNVVSGGPGTNLPSIPPNTLTPITATDPNGGSAVVNTPNAEHLVQTIIASLGGTPTGPNGAKAPILQQIFSVIDAQAVRSGIWQDAVACNTNTSTNGDPPAGSPYFKLGAQLVTANPLAEISFWGYANLRTAYSLWQNILDFAVAEVKTDINSQVSRFARTDAFSQANNQDLALQSKFYGFVSSVLGMISTVFFMCGYTLAFVVPLLPFFRFFFSVLTWVVSVLEAVVAVPLIALGHLNPEGEGLPGPSAKAAYFMIFNIFLRPVMTIFGLIAGLLVFYVAVMLLNVTYNIAVAGTTASYHFGMGTLIRIAFTVMYGATVYVCANNCFKTIGAFPEHALRWIGAQAHHERMGDGGQAVRGVMGQAQGYMGEKAISLIKLKPT